ncbi:hypothetical protein FRC06_001287 [Ceratobasidium sp. 370]|nr:hypothetical protein FRC06_001287 [Ceratobasidium sp. 370]
MAPHHTLPPLCAEASTVSMALRERMPAKRRAKAIKNGQPMANPGVNRRRKAADPPAPTLAGTQEWHSKALDVAYLRRPNGYHIKQVVHRSSPPAHAHPVLYLPGQDDIPRSSNEESDDGTASTVPDNDLIETTAAAAFPAGVPDIDRRAYAGTEVLPAKSEDMDYDAEGETDKECMEDNRGPSTLTDHPFSASFEGAQPNSMSQTWPNASGPAPTNDLIGNASEEDVRALFDGLDQFPTDFPAFTESQVLDAGV